MRNGILALVAVTCGSAGAAEPVSTTAVPQEAADAVRAALPKGWTATARGDTLTVAPPKAVGLYNPIGLPLSAYERPPVAHVSYEFTMKFRPRVAPEDRARQAKENAALGEKLEKMRDGLRAAGIAHKFDDWAPITDEHKKMVAEYRAGQAKLHRLPDLHSDTHSIDFATATGGILQFVDQDERAACQKAEADVRKVFKSYPTEKDKR